MPKAYSLDLRLKVMKKRNDGLSVKEVANMFSIGKDAIRNWDILFRKTGSYEQKKGYQKGYGHIIVDLIAFKNVVDEKPEITQKELAVIFNTTRWTAGRALQKIGYSKKKDIWIRREK